MTITHHEPFIRHCYALARQAAANGDHPFGALLARDGQVLLTAVNTITTDHDVTRHAELNLISQASRQFDPATLAECTLYTSTEPCAMCAGAIFWAGVPAIVYGSSAETLGEIAGGAFVVPSRVLLAYGQWQTAVTGPILPDEGRAIHQAYWPSR